MYVLYTIYSVQYVVHTILRTCSTYTAHVRYVTVIVSLTKALWATGKLTLVLLSQRHGRNPKIVPRLSEISTMFGEYQSRCNIVPLRRELQVTSSRTRFKRR